MELENMSVKEIERLLAALRKARAQELLDFLRAWPNPTHKQAKRIAMAKKAYDEIRKAHLHLKKICKKEN